MMNHREKTISMLEEEIHQCRYWDEDYRTIDLSLLIDILELLEEQQAMPVDTKMIGTERGDIEVYCCRACRFQLDPTFHFCPNCGKEVIWDDRQRENY